MRADKSRGEHFRRRAAPPLPFSESHLRSIADIIAMAVKPPSLLLTTSKDRTLKLWDLETGICKKMIKSRVPSWFSTVAFSTEGKLFACGSFDNYILIYTVAGECASTRLLASSCIAQHWKGKQMPIKPKLISSSQTFCSTSAATSPL